MELEVKTYATLQKFSPPNTPLGGSFRINIEGETILDVIEHLKLPSKDTLIIMINGNRITDFQQKLNDNDLIVFFPQLGGG